MKKHLRTVSMILLAAVFVVGIFLTVRQMIQYRTAEQSYDHAQQIAFGSTPQAPTDPVSTSTPDVSVPEAEATEPEAIIPQPVQILQSVNIAALQLVNSDVLGWIYIPDTVISYPLMRTDDRDEYLHLAWDRTPNDNGSIFLEKSNSRDLSDFNTIIYGHLMANGTMFGSLKKYAEQDYRDSHPYIYIATADGVRMYHIFSAYEASIESDTYRLYFADEAAKQTALSGYIENSVVTGGPVPEADDRILTLSTCTGTGFYSTRWVVQAVLEGYWAA